MGSDWRRGHVYPQLPTSQSGRCECLHYLIPGFVVHARLSATIDAPVVACMQYMCVGPRAMVCLASMRPTAAYATGPRKSTNTVL